MYQNVYLTLSDGRVGLFSGVCFLTEDELKKGVKVTNVSVGSPTELPEGMTWEKLAE